MRYHVGDYLASEGSVLLEVIVAFPGPVDVYGLKSVKIPTELLWYSIDQLDSENFQAVHYLPQEFDGVEVGDRVICGPQEYRSILAVAGRGVLLSQSADKTARFIANALTTAKSEGAVVIPDEAINHLRRHGSARRAAMAVDGWYDKEVMTLMNWHLARE